MNLKHCLCLLCIIFISLITSAQEDGINVSDTIYVKAPNTNVYIIPPKYFETDESINGFAHPGSATTIQIIEIANTSFEAITKGITEDYINNQGYTYISKEKFQTQSGKNATLFYIQFKAKSKNGELTDFERIMFFSGEENAIWININYPLNMKKLLTPALLDCLRSVKQ